MWLKILLLILLLPIVIPRPIIAQTANDVTSQIENLGNPTKSKWPDSNTACRYARNVWDLQNFNSKLYVGSGNSSNSAPCANAGPVPIIAYTPGSNTFATEFTVNEEQIDIYRIINGALATPGHDPKADDLLSWYRLESGNWVKHSSPLGTVHMYDIYYFGGKLFASTGSVSAMVSMDDGLTWADGSGILRGYTLFEFKGKMYVSTSYMSSSFANPPAIYEYNGSGSTFNSIASPAGQRPYQVMFPGQPFTLDVTTPAKLLRVLEFNQKLVYIGAANVNDHQSDPFKLFSLTGISPAGVTGVQTISLPGNAKPWDLLVGTNGKLYVLGSIANGSRYWVTVMSSSDLTNWVEEFRFDASTFARSFEQLNGDFYFGLGTDTTALSTATGDILRYKVVIPSPSASAKPGDLDGDNDVDIFDYNTLLTNFGKTGSGIQGDIDNSGKVDIFDYNLLLTNFGK